MADYWMTKINDHQPIWCGLFEKEPINEKSIIISSVILNPYSNQHEEAWAVYPNPQSILGFLQYIFLPTAYIGLIKRQDTDQDVYYFEENLSTLLAGFKEEHPEKTSLINKMEKLTIELDRLWYEDDVYCFQKLKHWSSEFNQDWKEDSFIILNFNIFASPLDAVKAIIKVYEDDLDIKDLEDEIGLTKNDFIKLAKDDIFHSAFMRRKFTDILTNRLRVTF